MFTIIDSTGAEETCIWAPSGSIEISIDFPHFSSDHFRFLVFLVWLFSIVFHHLPVSTDCHDIIVCDRTLLRDRLYESKTDADTRIAQNYTGRGREEAGHSDEVHHYLSLYSFAFGTFVNATCGTRDIRKKLTVGTEVMHHKMKGPTKRQQ